MGFRFGTWPSFNGHKVVLEDDERLNAGVPTAVAESKTWRIRADFQAVAVVPIRVDGIVAVDGILVML